MKIDIKSRLRRQKSPPSNNRFTTKWRFLNLLFMCVYLQVGIAVVGSGGVDPVLVRDDFPELGTDLVAALAGLEVDDFSHSGKGFFESKKTLNNDESRSIVRCNRAEEIDWWK
jgi:hypothetical protein